MPTAQRAALVKAILAAGRRESRASLVFRHVIAERAGVHVTDAECLDFLLERGQATAGELARMAGLTTGAMTSAIDRLERKGLVRRTPDPGDRRKVIVRPIRSAIRGSAALYAAFGRDLRRLLARYTTGQLTTILDHSRQLTAVYGRQIDRLEQKP